MISIPIGAFIVVLIYVLLFGVMIGVFLENRYYGTESERSLGLSEDSRGLGGVLRETPSRSDEL